ncbi:condensation domain-containing protein, partial [Mycobacterium sp. 1465703.0]|uniref:condensation domain-containing protein n=1 Tax=Mycobacterium sp. 1465703.0 TaxID=1834078 RepID=UPI000A7A9368
HGVDQQAHHRLNAGHLGAPPGDHRAVSELARSQHTTVSTVLQGAWALLLTSLTGQHDVVFGAVVSGRGAEVPGVESMVGLLINTVPVRAQITPATTTAELLDQLQHAHTKTLEHQHLPLTDVHRITGHAPLFDTVLVYENYPTDPATVAADHQWAITEFTTRDYYHYPLTMQAGPGRELQLLVQFRTDVFDAAGIDTLIEWFNQVLVAMTTDPTQPVSSMDLSDGSVRSLIRAATTAVSAPPHHHASEAHGVAGTIVEDLLTEIYAQVLGIDHVGIDESFFDLGGDSISAMRAIAAINAALDIDLSVSNLFDAPSIRGLCQQAGRRVGKEKSPL